MPRVPSPPLSHDALGWIYDCLVGEDIHDEDPDDTDQTELLAEHFRAIATLRTLDRHAAEHLHQRLLDATFAKVWYAVKYNELARVKTVRNKMLHMLNSGSQHPSEAILANILVLNTNWGGHIRMCARLKDLYNVMRVDAGPKACKAGVVNLSILRKSGDSAWWWFAKRELKGFTVTLSVML